MKKMYRFFSLEFHIILSLIITFISYLFPIAVEHGSNGSNSVEYGFMIFGGIALVAGIIAVVMMIMIDIFPKKFVNSWKYLLLCYFINMFINLVYSLFYAPVYQHFNSGATVTVGNGYIFQLVALFIAFVHMYNVYHDDYMLFNESGFKNFLRNNEDN